MANREQRTNKEKKKPKSSKPDKQKTAPPPFVAAGAGPQAAQGQGRVLSANRLFGSGSPRPREI